MKKLALSAWPLSLLTLALAFPSQARAWAEHHAITSAALKPLLGELSGRTVPYTEFEAMAHDLGYANAQDFNTQIQISRKYAFSPKLGEEDGKAIAVADILAKYSDEPDWGMDQELFGQDEYPGLWDQAYSMMGGKLGVPSQAFRHMFWQGLSFFHPLKTFKLPLGKEFKPMGQAPARAALFIQLAREAHEKGHPYWAVRFVADALHYLEDCSQPFHTAQTPTKEFLFYPLFSKYGHGFSQYVDQMTNIISYYHYSFEDYVSYLMVGAESGDGNVPGNQFIGYLGATSKGPRQLAYADKDMENLVKQIAKLGVKESAGAGRSSLKFFPHLDEDYLTMDPRFMDHKMGVPVPPEHKTGFEDDAWWAEAKAAGAQPGSPGRKQYFQVVQKMFGPLGFAVRQVVSAELDWAMSGK